MAQQSQYECITSVLLANPRDEAGLAVACSELFGMMGMFWPFLKFAYQVLATRSSFWQAPSCEPYHSDLHAAAAVAFFTALAE